MKTLLTILTVAFFATVHAQTELMQKHALPTEWGISIDGPVTDTFPNAAYAESKNPYIITAEMDRPVTKCWGIDDTPTLTNDDRIALRLDAPKLKWHDFRTYKFKGHGKRAVWISYAAAGILHGGREAIHAEPGVFEKRFGVSKTSFFGSEQWVRQYKNNDPEQPHKNNLFNGLRDYWHFSGATTKYILVGGAFTIGHSKQPIKYKILDTLIGFAGFSLTANLTYNLLR